MIDQEKIRRMKNGHLVNSLHWCERRQGAAVNEYYKALMAEKERRDREGWDDGVQKLKVYPRDFITVDQFKTGYPDFEEHYFEDRKKPDGIPVLEIKVFLRVLYSKQHAALMVTELGQITVACGNPIEEVLLSPIIQIAGKINCGELIGRTVDDFKAREVFGVYDNHSEKNSHAKN